MVAVPKPEVVRFTLDGQDIEAQPDETIWAAAARYGTKIPHLCHSPEPGYRPDVNCRACLVEVEGQRVLAASCKIGRAHVCTPVPNAHLVCRLLLVKKHPSLHLVLEDGQCHLLLSHRSRIPYRPSLF